MTGRIRATLPLVGQPTILVQSPLEDLWHDYEHFIQQARQNAADVPETMFLHMRFLRAALLFLFAYAEGVTSRWIHEVRAKRRQQGKKIDKPLLNSLVRRMEYLTEAAQISASSLNLKAVKEVRDLWVHFTASTRNNDINDVSSKMEKIYDWLSLSVVQQAATDTVNWMSQVSKALGVERHPESGKLANTLASALGRATKSVNSGL
jgi:chorismate mutase